jgi:hypothetical protein
MRKLGIGFVLALTIACGSDSTGPSFPNMRGNYAVVHTLRLTEPTTGVSESAACTGTFTITDQSGGSFSGSFIMSASQDCGGASGSLAGEVRTDGGINFARVFPGADPRGLSAITGCSVTSADSQYNGVI